MRDGHAPEVVPAEADIKPAVAKPGRHAVKHSRSQSKAPLAESANAPKGLDSGASEASAGGSGEEAAAAPDLIGRQSVSPIFLSPATSLNSNSSNGGKSDGLSQQAFSREADSFADAIAATRPAKASATDGKHAAAAGSPAPAKQGASTAAKLSSAALKAMEGGEGSKGGKGDKASSRASAKSRSRSSSVAASEWADVELQSEAEEEGHGVEGQQGRSTRQSGPPPTRLPAAVETAASAAGDYFESDNESEMGIEGDEHGQSEEHSVARHQGMSEL